MKSEYKFKNVQFQTLATDLILQRFETAKKARPQPPTKCFSSLSIEIPQLDLANISNQYSCPEDFYEQEKQRMAELMQENSIKSFEDHCKWGYFDEKVQGINLKVVAKH